MTRAAGWLAMLLAGFCGMSVPQAMPAVPAAPPEHVPTEAIADAWRTYRPRFVPVECWFAKNAAPVTGGVVCGSVAVPEDRADAGSRMISLAVMTVPAASQPAPSGTLVWLDPGPGNASISAGRVSSAREGRLAKLHAQADLVFFDQRGTGYSERDFCRKVKDSFTYGVRLEPEGEALFIAGMRRCLEQARADGIAIDAYSSWHIALDARDIRIALGIDRWNVFGFGTSTEIAQAIVQVDEEGVRSVILDGPVPTQRGLSRAASLNMDRALRGLTQLCQQQARCAAVHGDFHQRVLAILDDYEREPMLVDGLDPQAAANGRLVFDDRIAANFLMFMIYSANNHADLPVVLSALEDRDAGAIHNYALAWFQPPDGRNSQSTRYAIKCRNNSGGRDVSRAELAKARREAPGLFRRLGLFRYDDECTQLPYGPPDPAIRATRSDVPALVANGRLNPVGTFEASQALAAGFPNGQMVLFPYAGVAPILNDRTCGFDLLLSFLAEPMAPLDTRCVQAGKPPVFLTEYRRTSVPGRWLIGAAYGTYPILPILAVLSLALPFLALPLVWTARKLRGNSVGRKIVPWAELAAWIADAIALGALVHLTRTLVAWAGEHAIALPAGVPATVVTSAGIAGLASVLALVAWGLAVRGLPKPERNTSLLLAGWSATACVCSFILMIHAL